MVSKSLGDHLLFLGREISFVVDTVIPTQRANIILDTTIPTKEPHYFQLIPV